MRPRSLAAIATEQKSLIAAKAASLVNPGSTIFIDASTTVQYMISHLATIKKSPFIPISMKLMKKSYK
ncbi:MAG: hypothetical protein IKJ91_12620 [Clostridia bacterium]|nr:hypothetical protein [Clostridia bacterium]